MESNNNSNSDGAAEKVFNELGPNVSVLEKVGYGFGDTASNIMYQAWSFFLAKFYTDVFGIPAKHAAIMFLVTRVWDMINDPMMGMIADRTKTRWGKFRPYLLWIPIPYGILIYMMFITPDWGMSSKLVYAYTTYILATMAYTAVNIPYSSLMAVITPNTKERTTISQYRFFFAFIGMLLITTFMLPLVKFFGGSEVIPGTNEEIISNPALGYQRTFGIFGILAIILFLITFLTTRERVQPSKAQKNTFSEDIKDITRNIPWIVLFIASIFFLTHNHIRNSAVAYYFDYVNGQGGKVMFSWILGALKLDFDQTTVFLTIQTFGMMAGVFISTPIKKYFGKKTLLIFLSLAASVLGGVFYWLPADNFILLGVMNFLWAIVAGATPVFLFAMFTDVADFHEWKFGIRATGLVIAGIMFAIKMGVAIGGFLLLTLLDVFGYVANQPQTPEAIKGIKLLFSLIPAAFILVCGLILFFYPVNNRLLAKIEVDLKARKSNQ
ncbi:MAG: MFS transporter [Sedimentisphaerales bacterium]|nr:MFS transporter [Sedimentisphaerales bacterium]